MNYYETPTLPEILDKALDARLVRQAHYYGNWRKTFLARARRGRKSEDTDLYPPHVAEWAYMNSDELGITQMEIDESPTE